MTQNVSKETQPDLVQGNLQVGDIGEKFMAEQEHDVKQAKLEIVILWLFIIIVSIVSIVAGYLLWAKINYRSP